ncbi:UNVERIFIED_CONTAM: hypothetical protein Sindi_2549000 [Sesamum indicum]
MENIWQHEVIGVPMYAVTRKLKALKPVFRQQRKNKGDLSHNVQLAKGFLEEAQNLQRAKMQWMKGGDQCSRVFFRKITQRRAARRILQINDENGSTHAEPEEVIHEFVSYYQNLLGGNRRQTLVDITYLRPWARHIITNEEASQLCLPFTPEDVKNAVFDISEDKAPGPDGYSSGFFKAAWPVVGTEVTRAVLNFFTTGKLLKQVNSILLALIPKDMQFTYHWKCELARVFQLGFADDLLLFCRADLDSVRVLKEGHLPMRYLGLPLISSRLTISDCQPLLSKIDTRIAGWEGMSLSYAGWVQIIKSVLSALSIYWASAFILPKAIIKEVEKRLRRFLWKGTSMTGYAKVAWKDVCKPIGQEA